MNDIYSILKANIAVPEQPYTACQLHILKRIIRQKHIHKDFFNDVLFYVFDCKSYRELSYPKMYRLIYILSKYTKEC